jgi:hypothetical protein
VRDDVFIDRETLLMTDFMNLKIKPTYSFRGVHKDMVCTCAHIGECSCVYKDICLYCVSTKTSSLDRYHKLRGVYVDPMATAAHPRARVASARGKLQFGPGKKSPGQDSPGRKPDRWHCTRAGQVPSRAHAR